MDKNSISTSELKANCARVVKEVARTRTGVVITKHGRPLVRLVPLEDEEPPRLFGFAKGAVTINEDIIEPIDVTWEAAE